MSRTAPRPPVARLVVALAAFLAAAAPAAAATFRVLPGGSIQAAIDSAVALGGDNLVKVAAGSFTERLTVPDAVTGRLEISGGWSSDFSEQREGLETRVDAAGVGKPLRMTPCSTGTVVVSRLTLTRGREVGPFPHGGGVEVWVQGDCHLALRHLRVVDNLAEKSIPGDPAAEGGGVSTLVLGRGAFELRDSEVVRNHAHNPIDGAATGAGVHVRAFESGTAAITGNTIDANEATAAVDANAGGFRVEVTGAGFVELADNIVRDNRVGAPSVLAAAGFVTVSGGMGGRAELRRNQLLDNRAFSPPDDGVQLWLHANDAALMMTDSVIAGGVAGVRVDAEPKSDLQLTNLTIADHPGVGLELVHYDPTARVQVANTLLFGNGPDLVDGSVPSTLDTNLVGVDPLFVDRGARDYRLRVTSPAIDAGNDAPAGGLGPLDVLRNPRVAGAHVDVGAHETGSGTNRSVGTCRATELGVPNPVPAGTHVCDCFSDPALRAHRCSFLLRDSFLWVRIPIPPPLGSWEGEWSILPWSGFAGPYTLAADVLRKGVWQPLSVGHNGQAVVTGKLADGKIEKGRVLGDSTSAPSDLRLLVTLPAEAGKQRTWELELLLPVATKQP